MKRNKYILIMAAILILALSVCVLAACGGKAQHAHVYKEVAAKAPTCGEDGHALYFTCECGKYFDADKNEIQLSETIIPATGEHTETWEVDVEPTCGKDGHKYKKCSVCGKRLDGEEVIPKSGAHVWGDKLESGKAKCTVCGDEQEVYRTENDKIYFGRYPQSEVEDANIKSALNKAAGELPTASDSHGWSKYVKYFYLGEATYEEDMWYIDVTYGDDEYRGVYFLTNIYNQIWYHNNKSNQLDNGYEVGNVYWFKWEPIEWSTIKAADGKSMLLANMILESQYWSAGGEAYDGCSIRQWLNEVFYEEAFNDVEAKYIAVTDVDNSAASTGDEDNQNVCENTSDKVFLPSMQDAYDIKDASIALHKKTTKYAQVRGAYTTPESNVGLKRYWGYGFWWLRSQLASTALQVRFVTRDGEFESGGSYYYAANGVVPALWLTL